ncbi:hypothetical protein Y032_0006g3101 [Ancylostoma ceylanicum]|uniref:Uncharacterized protein n=1 Tax=Ancylostoma ceylanicum TaxID=53326 RepID=A0A016VSC1_9BILA|nr:hypothetical protein Y032_0006g3101 [Ancylostoma ceylanicum]
MARDSVGKTVYGCLAIQMARFAWRYILRDFLFGNTFYGTSRRAIHLTGFVCLASLQARLRVLRIVIGGAFALVFVIIFTILYCCFRSGSGKRPSKNTKSTPETTRSTGAESSSSAITDSSESRAMISATTTSATAATTVTGQTRTQPDHSL